MLLLFPVALLEISGVGSWCLRLEEVSAPRKERRTDRGRAGRQDGPKEGTTGGRPEGREGRRKKINEMIPYDSLQGPRHYKKTHKLNQPKPIGTQRD